MTRQLPELPQGGKYIDILTDWSFKRVFSGTSNKRNLIELLNDLLDGEKHIRDLVYLPTEELGDNREQRRIIFDLKCEGDNNEVFLIEMQRVGHHNFRDRVVFSTSRIISNHYAQGDDYRSTALPEVYFIGILDLRMDAGDQQQYIHRVELTDRDTGKIFYPRLKYIFLELANFVKTDEEIRTDMDQWFWLFRHLHKADRLPAFLQKNVFSRIFNIAEIANLTTEELMAYNARMQAKWDWDNAVAYAVDAAVEKERAKMTNLLEEERAKAAKLLEKERARTQAERTEKLAAARSIKELNVLTNEQI